MTKSIATFALLTVAVFAPAPTGTMHLEPRVLIVSAPPPGTRVNPVAGVGTEKDPFSTIQQGVDAAHPGDTVRVKRGIYRNINFGNSDANGPVVYIQKGGNADGGYLTLEADTGVVIQFDGGAAILAGPNVSYVKIQNFNIEGPAASMTEADALRHRLDNPPLPKYNGQGIAFTGPSDHIEISGNDVTDACSSGIRVNKGDYITIQKNRVSGCTKWTASASSAMSSPRLRALTRTTT